MPALFERLNGESRRRVKTQGSLPSEDAALVLLSSAIGCISPAEFERAFTDRQAA